jgi:hypothetical protein
VPGIAKGTEANGCGALSDWPCAVKNSFHIFHLPRPCPAEMALKMGALQFSYVKPWGVIEVNFEIFEFFGTQTIEVSRKFQSRPLFGWRKMLIYLDINTQLFFHYLHQICILNMHAKFEKCAVYISLKSG